MAEDHYRLVWYLYQQNYGALPLGGVRLSPHPAPFGLIPIHEVGYCLGKRTSGFSSVKNRRVCLVLESENAHHFGTGGAHEQAHTATVRVFARRTIGFALTFGNGCRPTAGNDSESVKATHEARLHAVKQLINVTVTGDFGLNVGKVAVLVKFDTDEHGTRQVKAKRVTFETESIVDNAFCPFCDL